MKSLTDILKNQESLLKEFTKHPRHKFIDVMWQRVNYDRVQDGYKPLPKKVFAIKTSHLGLEDLDFLVKKMCQSPRPGRVFFGMLKPKKDDFSKKEN